MTALSRCWTPSDAELFKKNSSEPSGVCATHSQIGITRLWSISVKPFCRIFDVRYVTKAVLIWLYIVFHNSINVVIGIVGTTESYFIAVSNHGDFSTRSVSQLDKPYNGRPKCLTCTWGFRFCDISLDEFLDYNLHGCPHYLLVHQLYDKSYEIWEITPNEMLKFAKILVFS